MYPHRRADPPKYRTITSCQCDAVSPTFGVETWGSGCRVAMEERIADLEAAARADQSLRSVAAHAAGMQPASADDPEWPPRWEAIASARIAEAEAERDAATAALTALRTYLTRSVADDTTVHEAWDILHNLAPEDLSLVLKWVDEIDGRPKGDVHFPIALFHRLLSAGLKDAEGDALEWITARVERCAEVEASAALAADAGAVTRLQGYDEVRRELTDLRTLGASIHKAVAAALEARAKELDKYARDYFPGVEHPSVVSFRNGVYKAAHIVRGAP